jgi:probable HAF family extracellular repeat protein
LFYTSFDYPGASFTEAYGINDNGQIVGFYEDANGHDHGFSVNAADLGAAPGPVPGSGLLSFFAIGLLGLGSYGWKRLRAA